MPCIDPGCIQDAIALFESFMEQPELVRKGSDPPRLSISNLRPSQPIQDSTGSPPPLQISGDDLCGICYTSELVTEPCVRLICGHVFHAGCLHQLLSHRWTTVNVSFGYLDCPSCKQDMMIDYKVTVLTNKLLEELALKFKIMRLSIKMVKQEGLHKEGRVVTEGDYYYGRLASFALH
mmetsp:Transcript_11582/g.14612  ORF Transcript_11582/g.14612 Transcript_11582/m.14612 type:complete len:178 (-) Transcript_11582:672-1205(-)